MISEKGRKWVAFDAAETLFGTCEPVAAVYARIFAKHGYPVEEAVWAGAFGKAFSEAAEPEYRNGEKGDDTEKRWWSSVVGRVAAGAGIDCSKEDFQPIFEELFAHYDCGNAWELFPDTEPTLKFLHEQGVGMAVVSNFDSRVRRVLRELGIAEYFEFTVTSADVHARKPKPQMIKKLIDLSGVVPVDLCLVGDSLHADGGAAEAAEIAFFQVERPSTGFSEFQKWYQESFLQK